MTLDKDPLWYKDAIIYELHVRAFFDSDNDGNGDFQGLIQKLDYLQSLGVTCIWLLPFYPSPLKDDGYDISDYLAVHSNYGNLKDFKAFIREAHNRGLRVITELVINHTSDQHPWFQAARRAKPNSARRNYFVWSDTPDKFPETRIIFSDTERSNWTWDDEAGAYFWHRFFSHQPDLNHNNPKVVKAVIKILRFWLDIGVDGLRLDAVPYLCVREGTNNENLPETHEAIKSIRKAVDEHYTDRMLLAEANQWPEDAREYFGDGDECHMAFHFPLMPRIFMAIRKEDRFPITEIIASTPDIPGNCQWGLFLRNHDELTLEMVTDEERDYMYREYVTDPRMRLNVGIRRRLAPLVDNDPDTIQMLNSLLFSFPGTPILYYGDEIGMGDNIYLGDRDGVRTPMQWSIDRNAGFSKADPAKLYNPIIMDPVYGYQAINVEAQERNPASMLQFMKRLIALRRQYKAFGRGSMEFLHPVNRKILAYIRRHKREIILCVVNLSRFVQPVELDLREFKDMIPMEMFGRTEFPTIGELPYFITLGPHAFYWFKLEPPPEPIQGQPKIDLELLSLKTIDLEQGWESLWDPANRLIMENDILPTYLPRQPWFLKGEAQIQSVKMTDWAKIGARFYFLFVQIEYEDESSTQQVFLPLRISIGINAQTIVREIPECVLAWVLTPKGQGVLFDALFDESACSILLDSIEDNRYYPTHLKGRINSYTFLSPEELRGGESEFLHIKALESQRNLTQIYFSSSKVLKLYRQMEQGPNPDIELHQFLRQSTQFTHLPRMTGELEYQLPHHHKNRIALGMLEDLHDHEGNVWLFTQVLIKNFLNKHGESLPGQVPSYPVPALHTLKNLEEEIPGVVTQYLGDYVGFFELLGQRTAELHQALGSDVMDVSFSPEKMTMAYQEQLSEQFSRQTQGTMETLNLVLKTLPEPVQQKANQVMAKISALIDYYHALADIHPKTTLIRCHGNLRLEHLLRVSDDFVFKGFEGNPQIPLKERRKKQTPLMDVATLLYSMHQAVYSTLQELEEDSPQTERWVLLWQYWISAIFLKSYLAHSGTVGYLPKDTRYGDVLLNAWMLNCAFQELEALVEAGDTVKLLNPLKFISQWYGVIESGEERPG